MRSGFGLFGKMPAYFFGVILENMKGHPQMECDGLNMARREANLSGMNGAKPYPFDSEASEVKQVRLEDRFGELNIFRRGNFYIEAAAADNLHFMPQPFHK